MTPGQPPEARRELLEEGGVRIDGELEMVGCYPMYVYGYDMLQISYRDDDVARLLGHIRTDLDRHLARVESV